MFFDNIINEAYFGKTEELLQAEKQLDIFRNKYMKKYMANKVNSDKDLLKFNRMIEDIFGFGCFTLHIYNVMAANAFTLPIDYRVDYMNNKKNLIVNTKTGFRFNKRYDYSCITGIYSALIFNPNFTTQEVMAILLHEIGHNFNSAINKPAAGLSNVFGIFIFCTNIIYGNMIDALENTNVYRKFMDKYERYLRENDEFPEAAYNQFMALVQFYKYSSFIVRLLLGPTNSVIGVGMLIKFGLEKLLGLKVGYISELSADNFATMYGYGSELSTAIAKLKDKEGVVTKNFDKLPILTSLIRVCALPLMLLFGMVDPHPSNIHRIQEQINLLERELSKNDIDPKMRECIENDIKACKDVFFYVQDASQHLDDPYLCEKIYNKLVKGCTIRQKIIGGRLAKNRFDEYDKLFKNKRNDKNG